MNYARIYSDSQGETHFDDVEAQFQQLEVVPGKPPIDVTQAMAAQNVVFIRSPAGLSIDYHPAPSRHLLVVIEDTTGKGHLTEVIGGEDFLGFFAWLDD